MPLVNALVNAALKSDYVAKVFCDEEDHSIRVTPVVIPSPIIAPKSVPASQVVPSPKPAHIPFKKRVRIMHAVSNLIYLCEVVYALHSRRCSEISVYD